MTASRTLGDYILIKQLGQGSLGTVFWAEHRFMKRKYLLKILPEELSTDRNFIARLEEDIAAIAALDHPHIVKIHNVSYANGQYFIVIDCIVNELGESTNLSQYLLSLKTPLKEEEIFHFLYQIADALDYAHSKKLIHRGVKLNNILVGTGMHLYLTDFGLSRIIGSGAVLTKIYKNIAEALKGDRYFSIFLQNYSFLAPEQRRLETLTHKADTYAFGILAYYLLMEEFPEGVFDMPSAKSYHWNWDSLIESCLQCDPNKRTDKLVHALESVKTPKAAIKLSEETGTATNPTAEVFIEKTTLPAEETAAIAPKLKPLIKTAELARPVHEPDPASVFQVDHSVKTYVPERKEIAQIEPILSEMVIIQGGQFTRGSNDGNRDETPKHSVKLSSFAIDIHPVTNEQFIRFLEVMGGEKDNTHLDIIRLKDSRIKRRSQKLVVESGYSKHPVVGVTWYGATAYAKWIGKRLPTEAEWEIAAQGGVEGTLYPTGHECEKSQANFFSADTTAVMSYAPNGYGLYDMAGNVYEWCQDWYDYNYYEISMQEPEDPTGPVQGVYRVLRGGCWKSLKEDLRCSRRNRNNPGTVNSTYGFRCAADVQIEA